jgi:hypothetical protein
MAAARCNGSQQISPTVSTSIVHAPLPELLRAEGPDANARWCKGDEVLLKVRNAIAHFHKNTADERHPAPPQEVSAGIIDLERG